MLLNTHKATFYIYFRGMKNTAIDYKKRYEESLLTLSEKEESLVKKDEQITQLSFERFAAAVRKIPTISFR